MDRPPGDLGTQRPAGDGITRRAHSGRAAEIAQAIADVQLAAVERNLVRLDRLRAIVALGPDPFRPREYSLARLDRLRAAMLERGFEWQKLAA
jgi:hypothetical protein